MSTAVLQGSGYLPNYRVSGPVTLLVRLDATMSPRGSGERLPVIVFKWRNYKARYTACILRDTHATVLL